MKKITIVMLLIMLSGINSLFAQSQGDMYVGTLLGMSITKKSEKNGNTKTESKPYITMQLDPGFHYFIIDDLRVGAQMSFGLQSHKYDSNNKHTNSSFMLGGVAAYYFHITDNFYFTPEVGFYFAHAKDKYDNNTTEPKANGFDLQILPVMLEFRPTTHFGFSASLLGVELQHMKSKDNPDQKSNDFEFNLGLNPKIGLKYYF
ncbi:MAG: porin family protein [Bacteroidales bacterium]|nr:porin family protein [Bacteroidales bacterium]